MIHKAVFRRPATSVGGALMAAELLAQGATVYAPGVGNHHGQKARASGFCFVNDIALGILRLRELGFRRIAYLDLDAHHGDGVEAAFGTDLEVLTISVHEEGRWPRTGLVHDPAHAVYNFAVPPGFHDAELAYLVDAAIRPVIQNFAPEILLVLPGADALEADKMSKLSLSNNAHLGCAQRRAGAGAKAGRVRRRRLQPLRAGTLLGGDLGDSQRFAAARFLAGIGTGCVAGRTAFPAFGGRCPGMAA